VIKTKTWIIAVGVLLFASLAAAFALSRQTAGGTIANIYLDGECIYSVDLSDPQVGEYTVSTDQGDNLITIEPGRICISEADCPDQVCVETGWISTSAKPIVCLPHRLVVRVEETAGADDSLAIDSVSQ
jgi:hypothetical protein